jgi:hypothetical protein
MIPELLKRAPQVRPVLDRYGLHGCGGALGPAEPLHFFALAHDVPLGELMDEIQAALAAPPPSAAAPEAEAHSLAAAAPSPADTIYLPFFRGGIGVVLTLGAVWGAFLLLRIALFGSFTAIGVHEVNAHGHAQIFGWVGLFVMGFAYQAFPRFKHTTLVWPALARQTFWWMLTGIVARAVLEPLHWLGPWAAKIAVGGGVLETAAIAVFALIIIQTLRRSGKPLAHYDYYVLAALFFFLVQSVYETVYCAATLRARTLPELLPLVVVFQSPLRDLQIHGFAMLMILGVSQRIFHYFYGFRAPSPRLSMACLVLLVPAILGEAGGMLLMRWDGPEWSPLWFGSVVLIFIATAFLVGSWHIFSRPAEAPDRSLKFLRTAYVWLFIALAMLVAIPYYQTHLLPLLARRTPWVLSVYLNPAVTDVSAAREMVRTVEDPVRRINRQIAHWIADRDLILRGVNVCQGLRALENPLLCVIASGDGIVPRATAIYPYQQVRSTDKAVLEVGSDELRIAHADMFISSESQRRVFGPIARWLRERPAEPPAG